LFSRAKKSGKGCVLFVHGLGEHIGRYDQLFELFNNEGFHCIGVDHYGHGKSPGKRGDIPNFSYFGKEIDAMDKFCRKEFGEIPVLLYGHSLGGNIALNYLLENHFDLAVISAPWLKLDNPVASIAKKLTGMLSNVVPSLTLPNGLDPKGISSDPQEVKKYREDPLIHDRISVRLFHQADTSAKRILSEAEKIKTPLLLMHGTADPITSHLGTKEFAAANPAYIDFRLFPGMRHELHHEMSREAVFNSIQSYINQ
ncbi:MAG: lysophospholipase, partial [Cyclobacteriaceae bacterium]